VNRVNRAVTIIIVLLLVLPVYGKALAASDPTAKAGATQYAQPGDTVSLDGSQSIPADTGTSIVSYVWVQAVDDEIQVDVIDIDPTDGLVSFNVPSGTADFNSFTFTLTVTDSDGKVGMDSCAVWVVPANYKNNYQKLTVDANANPTDVYEGERVELQSSVSNTIAGVTYTYLWTKTEGSKDITVADPASPETFFNAPDEIAISGVTPTEIYQLRFEVTDPTGYGISKEVTVTVRKNMPPGNISHALVESETWKILDEPNDIWESKEPAPVLAVNNASDIDGDEIVYDFEVYNDPGDGSEPTAFECGASGVLEGENITRWMSACQPMLSENIYYYWRAKPQDAYGNEGNWTDWFKIFINAENSAPTSPTANWPIDTDIGDTYTPEMKVNNATDVDDPDGRSQLTYEFWIYGEATGSAQNIIAKSGEIDGNPGGVTDWTVSEDLVENETYWWKARALDAEGAASGWTDAARFLINHQDDTPETPTLAYPEAGSEIDTLQPFLLIEGGLDPEGKPVVFQIELDTAQSFASQDLIQSGELSESTWQVAQELNENTFYFYRVNSSDGANTTPWGGGTAEDTFFVNQTNDPPNAPTNLSPPNTEIVHTLSPALAASKAVPVDPDNDAVTYDIELFLAGNLSEPIIASSGLETPSLDVVLKNGKKYFWHIRAVDDHGIAGDWVPEYIADLYFTTVVNQYVPSTPALVNPLNGGTVNTETPTLSVVARDDGDGLPIFIEFELYDGSELSEGQFVSYGIVTRGDIATSWLVDVPLTDQTMYYWRARARDESVSETDGADESDANDVKTSPWSSISRFSVDLAGQADATQIQVWQAATYDPDVPWDTEVEVTADCNIRGAKVIIPAGAFSSIETIYIGEATNVPSFSDGLIPTGKIVEFGPSGIDFYTPATIKIPYTDDELKDIGITDPNQLSVYTYNKTEGRWDSVPVVEVDQTNQILVCMVDHFSLYASVVDTGSGNGGSSGGGGCFIQSADDSFFDAVVNW
jgi:hypothetical protein